MSKRYRWLSLMLALFVPIILVGTLLAGSNPWGASSVALDPPQIDLRQRSEITATIVLSNTGADAPGLALTCTLQAGTILTYSAGISTTSDGLTWTGDVSSNQSITLSLVAHPTAWPNLLMPCTIADGSNQQFPITGSATITPATFYLPIVLHNVSAATTTEQTNPGGGYIVSASSHNYTEALAGAGQPPYLVEEHWQGGWFQSIRWNLPSDNFYAVMRSYLEFDTSSIPPDGVVSNVVLSLVVRNTDTGQIGDFSVHQGDWASLANAPAAWAAFNPTVLAYQTAVISGTEVHLTLPVASVTPGGTTRLVIRLQ
ncbi:MAG TPA: hypothetical protein VII92_09205, partial [Anaerolineae bacterium]